jgi:hypothetical protein
MPKQGLSVGLRPSVHLVDQLILAVVAVLVMVPPPMLKMVIPVGVLYSEAAAAEAGVIQ